MLVHVNPVLDLTLGCSALAEIAADSRLKPSIQANNSHNGISELCHCVTRLFHHKEPTKALLMTPKFIVRSQPRTGSHMLATALDSYFDVKVVDEVFSVQKKQSSANP